MAEVLSPVGNTEMLYAAVRSGADAVYLGSKEFNARRNAENFDKESMNYAIQYCHIRGVKVYLALNIMISDNELISAVNTAKEAAMCGIDGVIVSDLGLASLLHKMMPDLPLHASTQLTVHSPSAIPELVDIGFKRVVVSREMSEKDLTYFCMKAHEANLEVEVFVHGALCMCMSGQCYLSAMLGGRSGNRGLCAGPCRLPFKVKNGTGYDLSLKDLSLVKYIKKLSDIGVNSFKIEGRMKRPEYVAAATYAVAQSANDGVLPSEIYSALKDVFSRSGFTAGYFENKKGKDMFGIRTKDDVTAASGALPKLHEIYRNEKQTVELNGEITVAANEPIKLSLTDGKNTVTVFGEIPEKAINREITAQSVKTALLKFGGTPYRVKNIETHIQSGLSLSNSALNSVRRKAAELLSAERSKVTAAKITETEINNNFEFSKQKSPEFYCKFSSSEQFPKDFTGIKLISLPLGSEPETPDLPNGILKAVDMPRGFFDEEVVKRRLELFGKNGYKIAFCSTLAAMHIAKQQGFKVIADYGMNIYNSYAFNEAAKLGAEKAVISFESEINTAKRINGRIEKGIFAYGRQPLMLTANCPLKNGRECSECDKKGFITDRKGVNFPIRCTMGFSEILNSRPLYLADKQNDLQYFDFLVFSFTDETAKTVENIIKAYKNGDTAKNEYTRGLYYRGVL